MSERRYTKAVERELNRLVKVVLAKESERRLKEVSTAVNRWKKNKSDPDGTLDDIRRIVGAASPTWSADANPGVPVAHAVSEGLLGKDDLSEAAWRSIEVLIALADI